MKGPCVLLFKFSETDIQTIQTCPGHQPNSQAFHYFWIYFLFSEILFGTEISGVVIECVFGKVILGGHSVGTYQCRTVFHGNINRIFGIDSVFFLVPINTLHGKSLSFIGFIFYITFSFIEFFVFKNTGIFSGNSSRTLGFFLSKNSMSIPFLAITYGLSISSYFSMMGALAFNVIKPESRCIILALLMICEGKFCFDCHFFW